MNKLSAFHVKLGQPLPWDVFDEGGNLLLRKGYLVDRRSQLDALLTRGLYVTPEDFETIAEEKRPPENNVFNPFWLWDDILSKVTYLLKYASNEDMLDEKFMATAALVTSLVDTDPDAALASILLKDGSRYAYAHSLHVAVMAAVLSKRLNWEHQARQDVVCAALSMNVAMIELQMALLHQQEPLSAAQRREIDLHGQKGMVMLHSRGIARRDWLEAVKLHHETIVLQDSALARPDGRVMSQLLRVLDVFCAKISPRTYRRAMQPPVAAREIFVQERERCALFVDVLVKEVGLYMPGTFVKLENGETSLVIKRGTTLKTPRAISLSRGDGMPFLEPVKRDTSKPELGIVSVVPREKILHALNLSKIWGYRGQ